MQWSMKAITSETSTIYDRHGEPIFRIARFDGIRDMNSDEAIIQYKY